VRQTQSRSVPVQKAAFSSSRAPARNAAAPTRRYVFEPARENPNSLIAKIERRLPRGLGIAATVVLLLGAGVLGVIKGGHAGNVVAAFDDTRNALANAAGFRITSVAISGRKQLTQDEVLALGGVTGRSSLLFLDASTVRDRLKGDPWIADATVQKLYPGRLQIDITERTPYALWQEEKRVSVVADDGTVLEPYTAHRFHSLPLIVGKGAQSRAHDFLDLLAQYPQVRDQVRALVLVGERRWNLRLTNGMDIRLPEANVEKALATLTKLDGDEQLLSRDIVAIDLRLPDRLTVQLSEDAAKARTDAINAAKPKRKAGDAA
jgi:cell division protein FtsQ